MPLIVNDETIDDGLIVEEMERMRPDYERVFQDQPTEEKEAQLLEWAKENVLERILIQHHAGHDPRAVPGQDVEKALKNLREEHGGDEALHEIFKSSGQDSEQVRAEVELKLRVDRLIAEMTAEIPPPTDEDVQRYYTGHPDAFQSPEQVHAAHIVKHVDVNIRYEDARSAILKIHERLQAGETFEMLASQLSDCTDQGGNLGWFPRGQMVQAFDDVVFAMEPNTVSDIFETDFGFHIAKVYEKRPAGPVAFDNVKEDIVSKLQEVKRSETMESFIDGLKEKADVSFVVDEALKRRIDDVRMGHIPEHYTKSLNSLLVKPAGPDCNMACTYCFYLDKGEMFPEQVVHRMSEDILEEMIRQAMAQSRGYISFGWQGGEPTLMGLDFFKKAVAFQKQYGRGQSLGNGLQTNGLLIDNEWVEFLKEYRFLVGLSLDGPAHIHDRYRHLRGGQDSWEKVAKKGRMMLEGGVAVNALSVVNDYSVQFPEEIYDFHKSFGFTFMQFIPCVESDPAEPSRIAPFSVPPESYGKFLIKLFDLWMNDFKDGEPTTSVRFFDSVFHSYVGRKAPECTLLDECGVYVVVEHNGDVYACDFFVDPEWKLGNIQEDRIVDLLNGSKQKSFGEQKGLLPQQCTDCRWLATCRGGCPKDRLGKPGEERLSHLCMAYKMFFEHADDGFRRLAEEWKQNQTRTDRQREVRGKVKKGELRVGRNDPCPCGSGNKFKVCCGAL